MPSISDLTYITPQTLSTHLLKPHDSLAIIDVRDNDYIGGHIRTSRNIPVHTHDTALPELVRTLADKRLVVFHCALSQQRGPSSALRYLRERERLLPAEQREGQQVVVLEGGFVKWQELYGTDERLTEDYQEDIWKYGY